MPSFDVVSPIDLPRVHNALQDIMRKISTRYNFKGCTYSIEQSAGVLEIRADDELKLKQVQVRLRGHLAVQLLSVN